MTRQNFVVAGMSGPNCERILSGRLTGLPGVDAVNVDHATGELVVIGTVGPAAVEQAVAEAGYTVAE